VSNYYGHQWFGAWAVHSVTALLLAALWCVGAYFIWRTARRRAGVFSTADLSNVVAPAGVSQVGSATADPSGGVT
jgi:hypothetical protein